MTEGNPREGFLVTLGDFSGPLDLLCHLVETRAMDASTLKLSDLLAQYVSYLLSTRKATLAELAEFFSFASRLLLRKVRALIPGTADDGEDEAASFSEEEAVFTEEMDEATLAELLERFKPYRAAAALLAARKEARELSFVRVCDEGGPPWFDIGDLYGLATLWWGLIEVHDRRRSAGTRDGFLLEVPDAVPEEVLVDQRMEEVRAVLAELGGTRLRALLDRYPGELVVTLLALLELSRLGRLRLCQEEVWADVEVAAL